MLSDEILSIVNVTHRYNEREIPALSDISFTLRKGEMLAVTGASGAGKSTLLKIAGTFLKPTAGDEAAFLREKAEIRSKRSVPTHNSGLIFQRMNICMCPTA